MLDVSVIIPFKDKAEMTIACLESLVTYCDPVKEILLVSNNSSKQELTKVREAVAKHTNARVLEYNHPFNFQKINNWGVSKSTGEVVFLLNNDIECTSYAKHLLKRMYEKALEPETGAVGCVLLYEDQKTIQHAGVYLVAGGTADHIYIGQKLKKVERKLDKGEYHFDLRKDQAVTAVTAAAVMVQRKKFNEIKGMDESFIICGGDVDLCLRLTEAGYTNWLIGRSHGYILHKESKSRSMLAVPYIDFVQSYRSYVKHFDMNWGDPYVKLEEIGRAK
jgi:GT2 family glycosyltransferase